VFSHSCLDFLCQQLAPNMMTEPAVAISPSDIACVHWSCDSSFGIATGYGLDRRDLIPGRGKILFPFTSSRPTLGPTQFPIQWVPWALSPGVKRLGREIDHSPSSTEIKNCGVIISFPHMTSWPDACLIKHRDIFTLFHIISLQPL
jgi:hypothetical protein